MRPAWPPRCRGRPVRRSACGQGSFPWWILSNGFVLRCDGVAGERRSWQGKRNLRRSAGNASLGQPGDDVALEGGEDQQDGNDDQDGARHEDSPAGTVALRVLEER